MENFLQLLKKNYSVMLHEPKYIYEDINFKIPQQLKVAG